MLSATFCRCLNQSSHITYPGSRFRKSVLLHRKTYTREFEDAAKLIESKKPNLLRRRRRLHLHLHQAILRLDRKTSVMPHDPLARNPLRRDDLLVAVGVVVDFEDHLGRALHRNHALRRKRT